jgi:dolichyl-phosphate beta-glucosyltransferase
MVKKLSVIIPAYNEEKRLPKTLETIDAYLSRQTYAYEILVVNDGSKDGTAAIVRGLTPVIQNLRLIDNKENHGKGYVVRQGMLEVKGEYRLFTDADNSTSIDQVEKIWPELENGFEVVIGSRGIQGAVIGVGQPWYRRLMGEMGNIVIQVIAGLWGIKDTQCGFKAFSAKAANEIFSRCKVCQWGFDVEALVLAKKLGFKIKEIPVVWENDVDSRVGPAAYFKTFTEVLQIRYNLVSGKYDKCNPRT